MYVINELKLDIFNIKMMEQYLKDLTYDFFNKYPLIKFGMNFLDVYKEVLNKYKFLNSSGVTQRNNIKFWIELYFVFGFDFLDKDEFFEINNNLNDIKEIGELSVSFKVYDILKDVCLSFDDMDLMINVLEGNLKRENNFDNFKFAIISNFPHYYCFLNNNSYWLEFYNKNYQDFSLNEIILKALNCDARYNKIERILWQ